MFEDEIKNKQQTNSASTNTGHDKTNTQTIQLLKSVPVTLARLLGDEPLTKPQKWSLGTLHLQVSIVQDKVIFAGLTALCDCI